LARFSKQAGNDDDDDDGGDGLCPVLFGKFDGHVRAFAKAVTTIHHSIVQILAASKTEKRDQPP